MEHSEEAFRVVLRVIGWMGFLLVSRELTVLCSKKGGEPLGPRLTKDEYKNPRSEPGRRRSSGAALAPEDLSELEVVRNMTAWHRCADYLTVGDGRNGLRGILCDWG